MEVWSRDAGTYYCNEVQWRALHTTRSAPHLPLIPVVFVHVGPAEELDQAVDFVQSLGRAFFDRRATAAVADRAPDVEDGATWPQGDVRL